MVVQVRVVRHVKEQVNIAANVVPRVNIQIAKEQEPANGATTVNVLVAKAVVKTDAVTVPVLEIVGCVVVQERIWVLYVHSVKVVRDVLNAMDRVPQGIVAIVLEAEDATHVMAATNARDAEGLENVICAVDNLNAVHVEATVTVPNARIVTASVLTVAAAAMFGLILYYLTNLWIFLI